MEKLDNFKPNNFILMEKQNEVIDWINSHQERHKREKAEILENIRVFEGEPTEENYRTGEACDFWENRCRLLEKRISELTKVDVEVSDEVFEENKDCTISKDDEGNCEVVCPDCRDIRAYAKSNQVQPSPDHDEAKSWHEVIEAQRAIDKAECCCEKDSPCKMHAEQAEKIAEWLWDQGYELSRQERKDFAEFLKGLK
jgi:hypothetical protein